MNLIFILQLLVPILGLGNCFSSDDVGDPLILTPYIEANDIETARQLSEVTSDIFLGIKSYSGYFTVNSSYNSNSFFWFFPAEHDYENAPVILWLEGGPGTTALLAVFFINGPFILDLTTEDLSLREYSWHKNASILYIDSPVGTGYSFTEGGYATNEHRVALDLHSALQQFFKLFPELQSNEFYPIGESYGGKFVPALVYAINQLNPTAKIKINLQGFVIWNGLVHPEVQMIYSDYFYQLGLIDTNGREAMLKMEQDVVNYIREEKFVEAFNVWYMIIKGTPDIPSLFTNLTGYTNFFNFLEPFYDVNRDIVFGTFITRNDVRKAIHVGSVEFDDLTAGASLIPEMMKSMAGTLAEDLDNYKGLIFGGQVDITIPYPGTTNFLSDLDFSGSADFRVAERKIWYVGEDIAGYVKKAGNLTEALVRKAGHVAAMDQPKWCLDLIFRFIRNQL